MKLYHGSEHVIEKPLIGAGKKYNDYGVGFYCTPDIEMANEWAVSKERSGYANSYEIELNNLKVLDLREDCYCMLHWLAILLVNRTFDIPSVMAKEAREFIVDEFLIDTSGYDVIIGYRADDSYFSFAQDFINGTISYRQLSNAIKLGALGYQIVLISENAFEGLRYLQAQEASHDVWFEKKNTRDREARAEYFDMRKNRRQKGDLYIVQIMDEEMRSDDERLR